MTTYLSPAQAHKELVNRLNEELKKLRTLLMLPGGIRVDALFPLPLRGTPAVDKKNPIKILQAHEADYRAEAIDTLTAMWLRPAQKPKETLRSPGACGLSHSALDQLNECNRVRMELIALMKEVPTERREELWRGHSNISSHQTLRMPTVLEDPLTIRFYWDIGDSITRFTVKELIEVWTKKLADLEGGSEPAYEREPGTLNFRLALSIASLEKLDSNEVVAVRRILPPHVRARVRDGSNAPFITSAPVPFVYELSCLPPEVKPLLDYDPDAPASTKKRSSRVKLELKPHIEPMNVYRYKVPFKPIEGVVRKATRNTRKHPT